MGASTILRLLILVTVTLSLSACDDAAIMSRYDSRPETLLARESAELLRAGNYDALLARADPTVRNSPGFAEQLPQLGMYFPDEAPKSIKLVGHRYLANFDGATGSTFATHSIGFEYEFPSSWVIADVALKETSDQTTVLGIRLYLNRASLEDQYAVRFLGQSAVHYLMVALAVAMFLFVLATLVVCIRTYVPRRKWLWIVFILFGVGAISLDWTSGRVGLSLGVQLFAVSIAKGTYGPLIVKVAFPFGAILFWWRRRTWVRPSPAEQFV